MKKLITTILTVLLVAALLAGCSAPAITEEPADSLEPEDNEPSTPAVTEDEEVEANDEEKTENADDTVVKGEESAEDALEIYDSVEELIENVTLRKNAKNDDGYDWHNVKELEYILVPEVPREDYVLREVEINDYAVFYYYYSEEQIKKFEKSLVNNIYSGDGVIISFMRPREEVAHITKEETFSYYGATDVNGFAQSGDYVMWYNGDRLCACYFLNGVPPEEEWPEWTTMKRIDL